MAVRIVSRRLAAVVSGWPAWAVTWVLRRHLADDLDQLERLSDGLPGDRRQEILDAFADLEAAAEDWRASANGNAETPDAETVASSPTDELLTTRQAAEMLDLTPRRVRQLAAAGLGVKSDGRWRIRRSDVDAYQERASL